MNALHQMIGLGNMSTTKRNLDQPNNRVAMYFHEVYGILVELYNFVWAGIIQESNLISCNLQRITGF